MDSGSQKKSPLRNSASASDESDFYASRLKGDWWDLVDNTPDAILASFPRKLPTNNSTSKAASQKDSSIRHNSMSGNILPKHLSFVAESVPLDASAMHKPLFPLSRGTEDPPEFVPRTPTKLRVFLDPPSTGGTSVVASSLRILPLSSSSRERERGKNLQYQPLNVLNKVQPARTILVKEDEDEEEEEEEEEVSEISTESDSGPSTRPPSLLDYSPVDKSQLISPPTASSPTSGRKAQGSQAFFDEASLNNGRKRPRLSGASDPEPCGLKSAHPTYQTYQADGDIFTTPPSVKVRNESRNDSPTKMVLPTKQLTFSLPPDTPSSSINSFFQGKLGRDLRPVIIAHSTQTQKLMDKLHLSWGVQYELARGVTLRQWTWEGVYMVLQEKSAALVGSNAEAAFRVRAVMQGRDVARKSGALWEELDREQAAIVENKGRGLGLMGEWYGQDNWYGGRVQQVARLSGSPGRSNYQIHLEAMEKRRSHRFARFCGSRRILQLRISTDLIHKENAKLKKFLQGKFILCGRVFVPFHVKDNCLYMVETNEDWEREAQVEIGDKHRISFSDFIQWHNPAQYNFGQALSRYVTRFSLALSTTIPVLEFEEKSIIFLDDIFGAEYRGGKASAEETMTDGCGLINQAALVAINARLNRESLPVALQGRIAGAKGVWLLHPTDDSREPKIWVRESQNKIKHPKLDRSQCIFELVAPSHPSNSVTISRQSIINLSFNDVPNEVLLAYVEKGLMEEIEPFLKWDHPKASILLWRAVSSAGNVSRARLARTTAGISRALGLTRRPWREVDVEEEEADFDEDKSRDTGRNEYSGAPLSLHESTVELLQAGFHPSTFKPLCDKLKYIIEQAIKSYVENYRIPLPESLSGFIVPDPIGILDEGEIYYRASQSLVDPRTQQTFDVVTGDVIVGRYPIRLASDLQKVKAVNIPQLHPWPDVIIASTKGSRSLASLLSGGDMDGGTLTEHIPHVLKLLIPLTDELFLLRERDIVEPFRNKPFVPGPPDLLEKNFQRDIELVGQFCDRIQFMSSAEQQEAFQRALLLSLENDRKGLYSMFHDNAVEKYGYHDDRTIRLAYMFNTLLDASKSGLRLANEIFESDEKIYGLPFPEDDFYEGLKSSKKRSGYPPVNQNDNFILNQLRTRAKKIGDDLTKRFNDLSVACSNKRDPDLVEPYETANDFAHRMFNNEVRIFQDDMSKIRTHVRKAHEEWSKGVGHNRTIALGPNAKKSSIGKDAGFKRAAMLFASPVVGLEATPNVEEIVASFAYYYQSKSSFSLQMAFRKLCEIKARKSKGGIAPCITEIDEAKWIPSSVIRAMENCYTD